MSDENRKVFSYVGLSFHIYNEVGEYTTFHYQTTEERIRIHSLLQWLGYQPDQKYFRMTEKAFQEIDPKTGE